MKSKNRSVVPPSKGRLAVLTVGMGAVATTLFAGVETAKKKKVPLIGSLTQMGKINVGGKPRSVSSILDLPALKDVVFGGWDVFSENAYEAARRAGVLESKDLEPVRGAMSAIRPMAAVFDPTYVRLLNGKNVKRAASKRALAEAVRRDIRSFLKKSRASRAVIVNCSSTETYRRPSPVHSSLAAFERGLARNDKGISPTMIYAYAALREGVPFVDGTPNRWLSLPFMTELAEAMRVPVAGSDFKTGQTLMKSVIAPAFKHRLLGVKGWFSTNILGNRDGLVLSDPLSFRSKEISKIALLDKLLPKAEFPDLYGDLVHLVDINYYPPRGDNKEGWDAIDIFGWMGYPMQIKINFLCRDSILAAPLALDLALLVDVAKRHHRSGVQDWLGFYFKSPVPTGNVAPEHDLSVQHAALEKQILSIARLSSPR